MKQEIYLWKNMLNQTTWNGPKLNWRLWKNRLCRHSPLQQSEVWSPSSDMESGWACFVLLKGRLSVLGKAAHSPCWSLTFTPHFAELQSGLPYVGHSFPCPNNQAEQSEVQWRTQPRPWPLNSGPVMGPSSETINASVSYSGDKFELQYLGTYCS